MTMPMLALFCRCCGHFWTATPDAADGPCVMHGCPASTIDRKPA